MPSASLPPHLETPRLLLRPLTLEDLPFFVELHGDAEVVRYLGGDGTPRTPAATRAWLERMIRWYEEDAVGPYAIARREDGELVGRCGITFFEMEREPSTPDGVPLAAWGRGSLGPEVPAERILEVGYVVHPKAWGHGYAPEAARQWFRYGFEERGEPQLHSLIHPDNTSSVRVAEKNGLERGAVLRMEGRDYLLYSISREAWRP